MGTRRGWKPAEEGLDSSPRVPHEKSDAHPAHCYPWILPQENAAG
ncbi:hypothetical protein [Pseudonocardia thermophila]|nr:hypothetical protein [Pseudonocardia thermophila]